MFQALDFYFPLFPYLSALRAAKSVGQKSESLIVVGDAGLATPSGGHP